MQRLIISLLFTIGCLPAFGQSPIRWTRDNVIDLHFHLHDPIRIESYWCTRQGVVAVEVGTRAALTAPLWHWKIRDGRLQFTDGSSVRQDFTLLSMQRGLLTVRRRSGEIVQFRYEYERQKTYQTMEQTATRLNNLPPGNLNTYPLATRVLARGSSSCSR